MHVGTTEIDGWDGTSRLWFGFLRRPGRCFEATMTMLVEGHSRGNGLVADQRVTFDPSRSLRNSPARLQSRRFSAHPGHSAVLVACSEAAIRALARSGHCIRRPATGYGRLSTGFFRPWLVNPAIRIGP